MAIRLEAVWERLPSEPMTTAEVDAALRRICRIQPYDDPSAVRDGLATRRLLTWMPDGNPGGRIWSKVTEMPKVASLDFAEAETARAEQISRAEAAEAARERAPGGKYHPDSNPLYVVQKQFIDERLDERLRELGIIDADGRVIHQNGTAMSAGQKEA